MARPKKPDHIAKRSYISMKATVGEFEAWKKAVSIFGASKCLEISLKALEKAVIKHLNSLDQPDKQPRE